MASSGFVFETAIEPHAWPDHAPQARAASSMRARTAARFSAMRHRAPFRRLAWTTMTSLVRWSGPPWKSPSILHDLEAVVVEQRLPLEREELPVRERRDEGVAAVERRRTPW